MERSAGDCILGERNSQWKGSEVGTEEGSIHGRESRSSPEGLGRVGARYAPVSIQPSVRD